MQQPEWLTDTTGKITGYKTQEGGADTVFPFSDGKYRITMNGTVGYFMTGYGVYAGGVANITSYLDITIQGDTITIGNLSQKLFTTGNIQPNAIVNQYGANAATQARATIDSVKVTKV